MRKTVAIILSIAILCSLFVVVFAVGISNTEDMTTSSVNPFEYAQAPDELDAYKQVIAIASISLICFGGCCSL